MANEQRFDAIVIGAGFGGIYALHKLRNEQGLTVRAFEKGGGIGGTWYFNRYPGAKSDTEGFVYRYSFDKKLLQDYDWSTRYLEQEHILTYLNHVVDRFDLRRDIQLNTEVTGAVFDEARDLWVVRTSAGESFTARQAFARRAKRPAAQGSGRRLWLHRPKSHDPAFQAGLPADAARISPRHQRHFGGGQG